MTPPKKPEGSPPQGAPVDSTPAKSGPIVPPAARLHHPKAFARAYAIYTYAPDGLVRRRLYLSLRSATNAKDRAEMRGQRLELMLVELVPVHTAKPRKKRGAR